MSMRVVPLALALLLLPAAASAQRRNGRCTGEPVDTTAADAIFRDCDVDRAAKPRSEVRPMIRPEVLGNSGGCYTAEFEFVVDTTGTIEPDDLRLVRSTSTELADALKAVLPALRYTPAIRNGQPVRQRVRYKQSVVTRVVVSGGLNARAPMRAPC